jgi:hypothetical protein
MRKLYVCFLAFAFVLPLITASQPAFAKRKTSHKRSQYSAAQRSALMDQARKICRKKYGAASTVYQLDYYKWRVVCSE